MCGIALGLFGNERRHDMAEMCTLLCEMMSVSTYEAERLPKEERRDRSRFGGRVTWKVSKIDAYHFSSLLVTYHSSSHHDTSLAI
jgi:hypothetical protein